MTDWRKAAAGNDWRMQAGGAQGGPPGDEPINPSADVPTDVSVDPREVARREADAEQRRIQRAAELSHGQSLAHAPEAERKAFQERGSAGAAAEALSMARGASGPLGAHLDELTGAIRSRSLSGPEYEREKAKAQQTIDAATGHMPVGPIIGAMMLPQPSSMAGRVGLNTLTGASEGVGEAQTLDKAPTEAMKKAAVAAVLSMLGEGVSQGMKQGGENLTDRTTAARQALKAAGLRGGISSQLAKRGMDDADALQLGRGMLDEDLIPFGGSKATIRNRAESLSDQAGMSYGAQLAKGDTLGKLDYDELGNAMLGPYNDADAVMQGAGGQSLDLVDQFAEQSRKTPGSFVGAGRAKASAWDSANFSDAAKNAPRLYRRTMGAGAGNIREQLARLDPGAAEALDDAAGKLHVGSETYNLAREAAQRELENNKLGMTELLAGIGGAAVGAPSGNVLTSGAMGLGTAFLGGLAKRRGNAAAAVALDKLQSLGAPLRYAGELAQRTEAAIPEEAGRSTSLLQQYLDSLDGRDE